MTLLDKVLNLPSESIPTHIATIMDGNGRWAKERGLPRTKGHYEGAKAVDRIITGCLHAGVKYLTLYAFSSENWNRPKLEIEALMSYLVKFLKNKEKDMLKRGIRLCTIGDISRLPERCQRAISQAQEVTKNGDKLTLVLALSYGSRDEITEAVKAILREQIDPEKLTPGHISQYLQTANMPDPDLMIRTSGEHRISNFLLWQLSYAEFRIIDKNWPDFTEEDLYEALLDYAHRHRRFGGL